jgi:hypothetical protein
MGTVPHTDLIIGERSPANQSVRYPQGIRLKKSFEIFSRRPSPSLFPPFARPLSMNEITPAVSYAQTPIAALAPVYPSEEQHDFADEKKAPSSEDADRSALSSHTPDVYVAPAIVKIEGKSSFEVCSLTREGVPGAGDKMAAGSDSLLTLPSTFASTLLQQLSQGSSRRRSSGSSTSRWVSLRTSSLSVSPINAPQPITDSPPIIRRSNLFSSASLSQITTPPTTTSSSLVSFPPYLYLKPCFTPPHENVSSLFVPIQSSFCLQQALSAQWNPSRREYHWLRRTSLFV